MSGELFSVRYLFNRLVTIFNEGFGMNLCPTYTCNVEGFLSEMGVLKIDYWRHWIRLCGWGGGSRVIPTIMPHQCKMQSFLVLGPSRAVWE